MPPQYLQPVEAGEQEAAIEISLKQSAAQRKNILKTAFSGQLVPQDPHDEPASVLLERIRAERAEREMQPKVRKTKQQKEIAAMASKLMDVLAEAGDWLPAQEAFRRCGVADGAQTEQVEVLYAELRALDKAGLLAVEAVTDSARASGCAGHRKRGRSGRPQGSVGRVEGWLGEPPARQMLVLRNPRRSFRQRR